MKASSSNSGDLLRIAIAPICLRSLKTYSIKNLAYLMAPRNQNAVVELIMKNNRIKDTGAAKKGRHDEVRTMARKP